MMAGTIGDSIALDLLQQDPQCRYSTTPEPKDEQRNEDTSSADGKHLSDSAVHVALAPRDDLLLKGRQRHASD